MRYFCAIVIIGLCKCEGNGLSSNYEENIRLQQNNSNFSCTSKIGRVEKFIATIENNIVTLEWNPLPNTEDCDIVYILKLYTAKNEEIYAANTTNSTHNIDFEFVGCMIYRATVLPVNYESEGLVANFSIVFSKALSRPKCDVPEIYKTSVVIECIVDSYEDNMCEMSEIFINCQAPLPDSRHWIKQNITKVKGIENVVNRHPISIRIDDMSEFTNYTCWATIKNNDGLLSARSQPIPLQTKEDVPDPPLLQGITSITNTSFTIQWEPPLNIPGILTNYRITVSTNHPLYFIPDNCPEKLSPPYSQEVDSNINTYTVTDLFPSYEYEVFVEAKTLDYGPRSEIKQVPTHGGIPEEPKDVDFNVIHSNGTDFNVSLNLSWIYPCSANGIIKYFTVDITGYPQVDHHVGEQKRTKVEYVTDTKIKYQSTITNLEPAFDYTLSLKSVTENNLESDGVVINFQTAENFPQSPILKEVVDITQTKFTIEWEEPHRKNGKLVAYYIYIHNKGPNHWIPIDCVRHVDSYEYIVSPNKTRFKFENGMPNYNYSIQVKAATEGKNGSLSTISTLTTLSAEPEVLRNLNIAFINRQQEYYNGHIRVSFKLPCNTNGPFEKINVILNGIRKNKKPHNIMDDVSSILPEYNFLMNISAEYNYKLTVQIVTNNFVRNLIKSFVSPSGVPILGYYKLLRPVSINSSKAKINISQNLFDEGSGDILYYSIIIGQFPNGEESKYGFWSGDEETWPKVSINLNDDWMQPYEVTPKFWNPFKDSNDSVYTFVIGEDATKCALVPNVLYTLKVRGFTKDGFRDSATVTFQLTEDYDATALIFGTIFGILGTAMLLGSACILWRKRKRWAMKKECIKSIPLAPLPISIKSFPHYYSELSNDAEKLKHEYTLLASKSSEITSNASIGISPQNKKKNRYTNVIAYDHSRVALKDIDESSTDYINASYIKGFSGNTEYIATQGPLEHTVQDFWKMIIQENATLIVMVAEFVEQNKEKCFKYFPNNHENMELENGIAIRCCTELDFKTYIVRTLLVQQDLEQWTITHLQFTDWPDFGCPTGTEIMLEFCQLMREYADKNDNPIILHCSAGIGRTGTLIALDILLQTINYNKDIDIFNTVLNLRRDRKNMVQTEKQYLYIHNCISDAIEKPTPTKTSSTLQNNPIYENLEYIKKELDEDTVKESQF